MPEEMENGCLWLWEKTTDYILTEWILDALPTLYPQDEIIFQYNQWKQKWSKKSCTLFSPIGAISDLMNIQIWMDRAEEWDKDSYNHWRKEWEWRRVQLWVDHICKKYNESDLAKEHWKVAYYSIDLKNNALVKKVLDKRYTICTWYDGNSKYNNDIDDNGVLNGVEFWKKTYGHAVNAIWWINTPSRIKDNYYETAKYNIYGVEHEFSEISCFFNKWYVFTKVKEDNLERIKKLNEMRTKILNWKEINSELRHLSDSKYHQDKLHDMNDFYRDWLSYIDSELKSLM
jgi:hypothetical protein